MKCIDFAEWLQQRLDDRTRLEMPPDVDAHVRDCDSCRGQWDAWNQISTVLPVDRPATLPSERNRRRIKPQLVAIGVGTAAMILLAFVVGRQTGLYNGVSESVPAIEPSAIASQFAVGDAVQYKVDPASLWQQIQQRDWIASSMPTVQSVRDSVAPMGRSFSQALTILTTGGQDHPS